MATVTNLHSGTERAHGAQGEASTGGAGRAEAGPAAVNSTFSAGPEGVSTGRIVESRWREMMGYQGHTRIRENLLA